MSTTSSMLSWTARFMCVSLWLTQAHAFVVPSNSRAVLRPGLLLKSQQDDVDAMQAEIEKMREEARLRIESLSKKLSEKQVAKKTTTQAEERTDDDDEARAQTTTTTASVEAPSDAAPHVTITNDPIHAVIPDPPPISAFTEAHQYELLHGTVWKVSLNIGREPGTWMPKNWGASGNRLCMSFELEFSNEQLYDGDDFFLNGLVGASVARVVGNQVTLGPTMTEGSRTIPLKNGGWRVGAGEGPMGTDLLRFYVELDEEVGHSGCDVSCPPGRIYCTCGYFPMARIKQHTKDAIRAELQELELQFESHKTEQANDESWVSLDKMRRFRKMVQKRVDIDSLSRQFMEAQVREPDLDLLRLSRKGDVGLTKEGGVCCKVIKGLAVEYHILGKFGLASVVPSNAEAKKYRQESTTTSTRQ